MNLFHFREVIRSEKLKNTMDWASSEWKQGLIPSALQKVNALEEKVEKLQKERQQNSLQNDCLKLALEKEKRKVDKEKQNVIEIQRELQALAETCKDLEDKQQKLQNDLQNRDSRIGSLEVLLSQAKNENCKLQQLVNDVKDLRPIREAALAKREQKLFTSRENSENISNEIDNSLKEKILEQEAIIKELRTKISTISNSENLIGDAPAPFKTPSKLTQKTVSDLPALQNRNVQWEKCWSGYSSTPAKENKEMALRHNSDSTVMDAGDEKLMSMQTRLKQLCQELDCQRHNFEASKNAMEQKFKEKENILKADLKYQSQATADLDRELKETKNKYQQEISQSAKKIDVLTLQLKKAEQAKELLERDSKSLESKISASEMLLKAKEEELKDLQKVKNACEVAQQSLQSLKSKLPELERKCKTLETENASFIEKVKDTELLLDGSNNLVKEKDTELLNVKKELEAASTLSKKLQALIQDMENRLRIEETKLQESNSNEILLKEKNELQEKELKQLNSDIAEQNKKIKSLQNELSQKSVDLQELCQKMEVSKNEYENKSQMLEEKLSTLLVEYSSLEKRLQDSSSNESLLKEKIELLNNEKNKLVVEVKTEANNVLTPQSQIDESNRNIQLLKNELQQKSEECIELNETLEASENDFKIKYQDVEGKLCAVQEERDQIKKKFSEITAVEASLKEKIELLEQQRNEMNANLSKAACENENYKLTIQEFEDRLSTLQMECSELHKKVVDGSKQNATLEERLELMDIKKTEINENLALEVNKTRHLESCIEQLKNTISTLEGEVTAKSTTLEEMTNQMMNAQSEFNIKYQDIECKLCAVQEERDQIGKKLSEISAVEASLQERIELLEQQKNETNENLTKAVCENEKDKLTMQELQDKLSTLQMECSELQKKVEDGSKQNATLEERLELVDKKKTEFDENLSLEVNKTRHLESCIEELKNTISTLEGEVVAKSTTLQEMSKQLMDAQNEYSAQTAELMSNWSATQTELTDLQNQLQQTAASETSLQEKLELLEKEKAHLLDELAAETGRTQTFDSCNEELKSKIQVLEEELANKSSELTEINQQFIASKEDFENKIKELETCLSSTKEECAELQNQLQLSSSKELSLEEKLTLLEKERINLVEELTAEANRTRSLDSSLEKLAKSNQLLKDELSCKTSEAVELNQLMLTSKKDSESKIQELERVLLDTQTGGDTLEEKFQEGSLKELSLKEKIVVLEKENGFLNDSLDQANNNIQNLQLDLEEFKKSSMSFKEESSLKSLQLNELIDLMESTKDEYMIKMQTLENSLSTTQSEFTVLQEEHRECAKKSLSLKEKLQSIEEEKSKVDEKLEEEIGKSKKLESQIEELEKKILSFEDDFSIKSTYLDEVENRLNSSKHQYEIQIEELKTLLSGTQAEVNELQNQLQQTVLSETSLREKLDLLEKEKLHLLDNLAIETNKVKNLEACSEEQKERVLMLEEKLSNKESEIVELNQHTLASKETSEVQIQKLEADLSTTKMELTNLQNQLYQNEMSLQDKVNLLEKERSTLLDNIAGETHRAQSFESCSEDLKQKVEVLEEELTSKSAELAELGQHLAVSKEHFEISFKALEEKYLTVEKERADLHKKVKESSMKEASLEEKLMLFEKKKKELNDNLIAEISKSRHLECCVEDLKNKVSSLEEALSVTSSKAEELSNQMSILKTEYESNMKDLGIELSKTQSELESVQMNLKESVLREKTVEDKLELLERKKRELNENLVAEIGKTRHLDSCIENFKKTISSLEGEMCVKSAKIEELMSRMSNPTYEETIQDLSSKITALQSECKDWEKNFTEVSNRNATLEGKIELLEKKKKELNENLVAEISKTRLLESRIQELKDTISALEKEVDNKSSTLDELSSQISASNDNEGVKQGVEDELIASRSQCTSLELQLKESLESKILLKETLDLLEGKLKQLTNCLKSKDSEVLFLENHISELKETVVIIQSELSAEQETSMNARQVLENKISVLEVQIVALELSLNVCSQNEVLLKEKLEKLEEEKNELLSNLESKIDLISSLQSSLGELNEKIAVLQNELTSESEKSYQIKEYKSAKQFLENKLSILEANLTDLEFKHKDCSQKEIVLTGKLKKFEDEKIQENGVSKLKEELFAKLQNELSLALEKTNKLNEYVSDKKEMEDRLAVMEAQYATVELEHKECSLRETVLNENLRLLAEEKKQVTESLEGHIARVNEKLIASQDELTLQFEKFRQMKDDYEIKLRRLETELSITHSKSSQLEEELRNRSVDDIAIEEKQLLLEIEKLELDEYLQTETDKTQSIKSKIEEENNAILCVDKELKSKSLGSDVVKQMTINETLLGGSNTCVVDGLCQQKLDLSCIDYSQFSSLQKFAFNFLHEICALEKDLIEKLEICKFLCWYQLLEDDDLKTIFRIFSSLRTKLKQCQILKSFMCGISQLLRSNTVLQRELHKELWDKMFSGQLSFALQDFMCVYGSTLNKLMFGLSKSLKKSIATVTKHSVFIKNNSTIHNTTLHLPVVPSSKYLIFIHNITKTFSRCEPQSIQPFSLNALFSGKRFQTWLKIKEILSTIEAQYVPFTLNLLMSLCENGLNQNAKIPVLPMGRIFDWSKILTSSRPLSSVALNECQLYKMAEFLVRKLGSSADETELRNKSVALEVKRLSKEFSAMENAKEALQQALDSERKKQGLLNATIEEIERDLSETFQEKEKFKQLALSAQNLLNSLRKFLVASLEFSTADLESECLDDVCFCESCIQSSEGEMMDSNHERLTPLLCLEWLKAWFNHGSLLEIEVEKFRQIESETVVSNKEDEKVEESGILKPIKVDSNLISELESENFKLLEAVKKSDALCCELQEKNSVLCENFKVASDEIMGLKSELEEQTERFKKDSDLISELESKNFKLLEVVKESNALCLEVEDRTTKLYGNLKWALDKITDLKSRLELKNKKFKMCLKRNIDHISELKLKNSELSLAIKEHEEKCCMYDDKIQALSTDVIKYREALQSKEEEIGSLKNVSDELNADFDKMRLKCEGYDNKIKLLNGTISELESENFRLLEATKKSDTLCLELEDKNSELCEKFKATRDEIKGLELELKLKDSELSLAIKKCEEKCCMRDDKIQALTNDVIKYRGALQSKEEEIGFLKNVSDELNADFDKMRLKCEEYENKIKLLNSTLFKYEEEKAIDEHLGKSSSSQCKGERCMTDEESIELMTVLQNKIESLRKSNASLNLTIETIKEELQNVYAEKKSIEEKLESILEENARLKDPMDKYTENKNVEELMCKLKELENEKAESLKIIEQLKSKIETLERDISILKNVQRQHEHIIFEKNTALKNTEATIKQLQTEILESEDLKFKLNEEKEELVKEIKILKLVENENLDKFSELELQRDDLISMTNGVREEMENLSKELEDLRECKRLLKVENSNLQKELKNEINLRLLVQETLADKGKALEDLNALYVETLAEQEKLKITNDEQSSSQNSSSVSEKRLQSEMDAAKREVLKIKSILRDIQEKCDILESEKRQMLSEIENLRAKSAKEPKINEVERINGFVERIVQWNRSISSLISNGIESCSWYPGLENLKSSLEKLCKYWSQSTEKLMDPQKENPYEHLDPIQKFFNALASKYEEESELISVARSIIDTAQSISQFCESLGQRTVSNDFAEKAINATLSETTFFKNLYQHGILSDIPVHEMQQAQLAFTESFTVLKNALWEKMEEVKMLKATVEELSSKSTAKVETKTTDKEKNPYEWKFNLIRMNYKRLEKSYNEKVLLIKELEAQISTLETEKKGLDEEAEELCKTAKRYEKDFYSTFEKLTAVQEQLKDSENEVKALKKAIMELQGKENGNFSAICQKKTENPSTFIRKESSPLKRIEKNSS